MTTEVRRHSHVPPAQRRQPVTSYRIQLSPDFDFADVERIIPYLSALGITDIFFSPILQAAPGSNHGYDVVDHEQISVDLGGIDGFRRVSEAIHDAGMHIIVDIVPNHMAVPTPLYHNRALWSLLRDGEDSRYLSWFDIELSDAGDGLLMPVLGERIGQALADATITLDEMVVPGFEHDGKTKVVRYYDHVFPIRRGTENLPLAELLDAQFYRLAHWRVANEELNYRRFFDVDTLAAIRVENPEVFRESHKLLLDLMEEGHIDAFRIDHPDGLADPREYFRNLAEATGGAWTVAEKILEGEETLPSDWPCAGTTGYDTLMRLQGLFTDPTGLPELTQFYGELSGSTDSVTSIEIKSKRQIVDTSLYAEVERLSTILANICHADVRLRDHTHRSIQEVIVELVVHMDRYRAYVVPGEKPSSEDERVLRSAAERAGRNLDEDRQDTLAVVIDLLLGNEVGSAGRTHEAARNEAIIRFQQVCGAVMAKGVEDTTFYRYTVLTSANEVGAGPHYFTTSPDDFHDFQSRLSLTWPVTMTTLSTHDTKRCEDVRARIAPIAQYTDEWLEMLVKARDIVSSDRPSGLDGQSENLLWQTLLGTWTPEGPISLERLEAYLLKASREQKSWTTWTEQNEEAERGLVEYAKAILESEAADLLQAFAERSSAAARTHILAQKAIQMTCIGVPDIYNGEEITQTSLVDPDNRRAVDYEGLEQMLTKLDRDGLPSSPSLDTEKLWVTSRLARLRRDNPGIASADCGYEPLPVSTGRALAFARTLNDQPVLVTAAMRNLPDHSGDYTIVLPDGHWRNVLTDTTIEGGNQPLADVLGRFPAAVLERVHD
ncbi:(1-_4)-alpha-D-glucan 1-alpha-D-glucosylmutase [Trueperella bonasi]|uniref:(1->4)-alpha-D-glucan 1-alpha-D-glucosylmutase n=1 Tax=Trueperella bonasi TaxID=312286 RepID=A0ABT9NIB1_9ACTO|nr:malto-oligosyltrehalose synthase [Trueperella bonasi]MDP9807140.1 (1->4)-alpha-D-glucan 1-alpha-D-glucosylmutase [Trueperella bonasi]